MKEESPIFFLNREVKNVAYEKHAIIKKNKSRMSKHKKKYIQSTYLKHYYEKLCCL